MNQIPRVRTIGAIADELKQPPERIAYLIRARRIQPIAMAGNVRLFGSDVVRVLRREINSIDARRGARRAD